MQLRDVIIAIQFGLRLIGFVGQGSGSCRIFSREGLLKGALPVFWKHGFAHTTFQEVEAATGVNKSGLYTEFQGKEDLFLATLRYYIETSRVWDTLTAEPAEEAGRTGVADAVEFGRHLLSNPDLPRRTQESLPLTPYERDTFYPFEERGCYGLAISVQ